MAALTGVPAALFAYAAQFFAAAAAVLVLVWTIGFRGGLAFESNNKALIFNIHPVLLLIGFIILGSEAILSYKLFPWSKERKKVIHLILHTFALVLGAFGVYAAFKYHNESNIANLYSLHSWVGIGTISLFAIQWFYGFVTFFYPGGSSNLRRISLSWHVIVGLFVYILAVATAELGFLEKLTFLQNSGLDKYGTEAFLVNFTGLIVLLLGASVVVTAASAPAQDPNSYEAIADN